MRPLGRAIQRHGAIITVPILSGLHHSYAYSGEPLAAIPFLERAMRLDPAFTQQYVHFLGSAYLVAGKYEAAAASFRERIRLVPDTDLSRALLACALGHLGDIDEAQRIWSEGGAAVSAALIIHRRGQSGTESRTKVMAGPWRIRWCPRDW